ncbi:hypothetical protein J0677_25175, partial [Vibrio parahaemolyticus]|nr:hypothetical protein [Vibrio parahaemolyticus]
KANRSPYLDERTPTPGRQQGLRVEGMNQVRCEYCVSVIYFSLKLAPLLYGLPYLAFLSHLTNGRIEPKLSMN